MEKTYTWNEIREKLIQELKIIFANENINTLTDYEKRKIIFDYLSQKISYDYNKLEAIRNIKLGIVKRIDRNLRKELIDTIILKKGICNSISQYYKLLLELVGIKSYCVVCDDGTEVNHQLNIVEDSITGYYSFDDITSVIVKRGSKEDYFDYNLETAYNHSQGLKNIEAYDQAWFVIPDELIYYYVNRNDVPDNLQEFPINKIVKSNQTKTI